MNILVIGAGGREHSILLKLKESNSCEKLYALPGNAGTSQVATNISNIDVNNHSDIIEFVKQNNIGLTVVGPEEPLIYGIVDSFEKEGLNIFGPNERAAILEASKTYSKDFMKKYNIPTADFENFSNYNEAIAYIKEKNQFPIVVKASGIAAGKGSVICFDFPETEKTLKEIMVDKIFGDSGNEVVIEEFLIGEEASIFAISDGNNFRILTSAQDHKQIFDGDKGPNTGGMGTYAPAPVITDDLMNHIIEIIVKPSFDSMVKENRSYKGVLFIGLMITESGPKVIEYNCRFGDPETQVILSLLDYDLIKLLNDSAVGNYSSNEIMPVKKDAHSLCLVMASGGYPASYKKGKEISGLENIDSNTTTIIHAGTKFEDNKVLTNGGRVLGVVSTSSSLQDTIDIAYNEVKKINFEKQYYRTDIGKKGLKYY